MTLQKIFPKGWPDANAFGGRFERYVQKNKIINDCSFMKLNEFLDLSLLYIREKTISFHTNMISVVEKLEQKAKQIGLNPLIYTSRTDTGLDSLKEYQELIISTSKLSRGVNLNQNTVFLTDTGRTHSVITALQMIDRSRDSKEINIRIPIKEKVKRQPRFYSTLKPKNKYQFRLHHFSKEMDYMDLNYKETLFYMVNDTYLNYLISDTNKTKLMNYFRLNLNEILEDKSILLKLGKVLDIDISLIVNVLNEYIIKENSYLIS